MFFPSINLVIGKRISFINTQKLKFTEGLELSQISRESRRVEVRSKLEPDEEKIIHLRRWFSFIYCCRDDSVIFLTEFLHKHVPVLFVFNQDRQTIFLFKKINRIEKYEGNQGDMFTRKYLSISLMNII